MSEVIHFITLVSIFIYIFGLVSLFIKEKLFISETLVATCFGLLIRKFVIPLLTPNFMTEFSRVVISLQVVAVGITVPNIYIRNEYWSLFMLLVPIMFLSFLASTVIIYCVGIRDWIVSAIISACITPTDPVLATAVLKGKFADKYIPAHLRNLLTIESGANDGLGYLLLTIPFLMKNMNFTEWILRCWIKEVFAAIIIGGLIGYLARKLFDFCNEKKLIDKESLLTSMIALGLFATGTSYLLGSGDILACFVCGLLFSRDPHFKKEIRQSHFMDVLDLLVNNIFFICFGASLTEDIFDLKYLIISILVLLFRRLPFFYLLSKFVPQLKNNREIFFAGWFGPIGVGALFFCHHASHKMIAENIDSKYNIGALVQTIVLSSILVHGLTAPIINFHLKNKNLAEECESSYSNISS